jgi:hypothetical protein
MCPMCAARHIFDVDPTEQGEMFYCPECGHNWRLDARPTPVEPSGRQPLARSPTIDPWAFNSKMLV